MSPTVKKQPSKQPAAAQAVSREVQAWVAAQIEQGYPAEEIYGALTESGWHADSARRALALCSPAQDAGGLVASNAEVAVPQPQITGAGLQVDAGDQWVQVLQRRTAPELMVFANVLSPAECDALMEAARPSLKRSRTVDTQTGAEAVNAARTSEGMFFKRGQTELVQRIEARIARLLNWPMQNGEGLQVLRYGAGAEYKPHYDYFDPAEPGTPALLARGGQRVGTLIIYLQTPEKGGQTVFPDIGLSVAPERGSAVFFSYAQAHPSSLTLHGGEPVVKGEKWIATKWLRASEFH